MYSVIVADDEKKVRNAIIKLGDWKGTGLEVLAEACNGDELCALADDLKPQIVLTDMRMPGINGADLVRKLSNRNERIKIVIISGYDDFEYTRQAITSGVVDYILKPVDAENLNNALRKAISEIEAVRKKELESLSLKIRLYETLPYKAAIENGDVSLLTKAVSDLYENLSDSNYINIDDTRKLVFELLLLFEKLIIHIEGQAEFSNDLARLREKVEKEPDIRNIKGLLLNFIDSVSGFIILRKRKSENAVIYKIKDYVHKNYQTRLTLGELAKMFYWSEEYISKMFKEEFGQNLFEYIMKLKVEKACEMILKGSKESEIVSRLGFSDESHFSKNFKKCTGYNPRMYKEKNSR